MCTGVCQDMCIDMCADMCTDILRSSRRSMTQSYRHVHACAVLYVDTFSRMLYTQRWHLPCGSTRPSASQVKEKGTFPFEQLAIIKLLWGTIERRFLRPEPIRYLTI